MKPLAAMALLVVLGVAPCALADDPVVPVIITSVGPKEMRLRVAAGVVGPCESLSNERLFDGTLAPGQRVVLQTAQGCVCIEHTYDDFPDANWAPTMFACRPVICAGRRCRPADDQTIRVTLSSAVPPRRE
jgi:hypothetical protein